MTKEKIESEVKRIFNGQINAGTTGLLLDLIQRQVNDESTATQQPSSNVVEGMKGFIEWAAAKFLFNEETSLWASFNEGEEFDVDGSMQFRFTTEELFKVYKKQK